MKDYKALYQEWLIQTKDNAEIQKELLAIENNDDEIYECFYKSLEFGTAGLRGILGAGTNRMNVYTVNQATQGLADYLNEQFEKPSVAIAYDSRINSDVFAKNAAQVFAANGILVHLYDVLVPTPMLSFAVRELNCQSGIIITASHNPAKYNGYKCYDPNGYQMTDEAAMATYAHIQKVDIFNDVKLMGFDKALSQGLIRYIDESVHEKFYEAVLNQRVHKDVYEKANLNLIYTPLNGAGNIPVREVLKRAGMTNVRIVPEQEMPDGHFPTVPYPNPEIKQAFECAMHLAKDDKADLLLATDPDCDRVGIAVLHNGEYQLLSGNEVGALLLDYLLSQRKAIGTLPKDPIAVKTIVTTKLAESIANKYDCEMFDLLTGFKYIGELITGLEAKGQEDRYILGFEESYGYLIGTHARDKDAVVASLLICEMASFYHLQGKTLVDCINALYDEHGIFLHTLLNFEFAGASGLTHMQELMEALRENAPKEIGGKSILSVSDYESSIKLDLMTNEESKIDLPASNVLSYELPEGSNVIVRPSGTEPKIKIYLTVRETTKEKAQALTEKLTSDMKQLLHIEN